MVGLTVSSYFQNHSFSWFDRATTVWLHEDLSFFVIYSGIILNTGMVLLIVLDFPTYFWKSSLVRTSSLTITGEFLCVESWVNVMAKLKIIFTWKLVDVIEVALDRMGPDLWRDTTLLHQSNSSLFQSQQFAYDDFSKSLKSNALGANYKDAVRDLRHHFNRWMKWDSRYLCIDWRSSFELEFLTCLAAYSSILTSVSIGGFLRHSNELAQAKFNTTS